MAPKNKQLSETVRFYEETMTGLRGELRRVRSKAAYYAKGAIPADLATAGSTATLIDGIFTALPPNLRQLAEPFKASAIKYAEENPEVVETIKNTVMQKLGGKSEDASQQIDSL